MKAFTRLIDVQRRRRKENMRRCGKRKRRAQRGEKGKEVPWPKMSHEFNNEGNVSEYV